MTPPPTVEILAIGNELLRGEILDTNTQWLCRLVTARGGRVGRVTLLADVEAEIAAAVRAAIERGVAVLFTSGGLGPTDDDLTLAAVARGAGVEVVLNEQARAMVLVPCCQRRTGLPCCWTGSCPTAKAWRCCRCCVHACPKPP